jgi:3-oxoacyl-[acyl-carrier-protein] synthase II
VETRAVLPRTGGLPVTGSKGTIGNAFECSALIDTALAVESLGRGGLPPVGLLRRPDPGLGGLDPVMGETRPLGPAPTALVTAFNQGQHSTAAGALVIASTHGDPADDGKART